MNLYNRMVLVVCIIIGLIILPVSAEEISVVRSAPDSCYLDHTFDVTLSPDGLQAGGIIETLPAGCVFVNTTYPEGRYEVYDEKNVIFSVINGKKITYTVNPQKTGTMTFSGIWNDALTGQDGMIRNSTVSVNRYHSDGHGGGRDSSSGVSAPASSGLADDRGVVSKPVRVESDDHHMSVQISGGVQISDRQGKALDHVEITEVRNSELITLKGTENLFQNRVYNCSPEGARFSPEITVSFQLKGREWYSLPEDSRFQIQRYDPASEKWNALQTTLDNQNLSVSADVSHFSIFGLFTVQQESENLTVDLNTGTSRVSENLEAQNTPAYPDNPEYAVTPAASADNDREDSDGIFLYISVLLIVLIIGVGVVVMVKKQEKNNQG